MKIITTLPLLCYSTRDHRPPAQGVAVGTGAIEKKKKQRRLQNSPHFCVFKYARAVKQKVWNEAENRERDWGETLKIRTVRFAYVIFVRITRFSQPRAIPIG